MRKQNTHTNRLAAGQYLSEYIDICRNCNGSGIVNYRSNQGDGTIDTVRECLVCKGSGKVLIKKEIFVSINPIK
jgi:DnaJ-class molecular chaperone